MRPMLPLAVVLAIGAALVAPLHAETPALITVTGDGQVEAAPDMATVTLGVTTEGATPAEAMAANSAQLATVLARLKEAGTADSDLQTTGLSLNPNWQNDGTGTAPRIAGYVATNMLTVRVRALDTLGGVLDAAIGQGANTFNGVSFGLADPAPAMNEARRRAVADAMARAELLAGAAGVSLGPLVSMTEGGPGGWPAPVHRMEAVADSPVPVAAGQVSTLASVTMVFSIAP